MKKRIITFCAGAALVFAIPAFAAFGGNVYETYTGMSGGSHMQKISSANPSGGAMGNYTGMKENMGNSTDPGITNPATNQSSGGHGNMTSHMRSENGNGGGFHSMTGY